ncbi:MAG: ATP-grasp domain-containing protein [Rhodobacteraceae bacterium]|nr:ATP-grasp domain-containing protein [Paracoccaceae bacterium]
MINKILIANRGEIACRIIHTCKRMGIATVGIYAPNDRNSLHVKLADEAYCVGPKDMGTGYLNVDGILEIARKTNSDAIHPGYGFLSENHEFAQKCRNKKIIFIGPSPSVIKAMGLKNEAKTIMAKAGIPVISGFNPQDQGRASFLALADKVGYPVMLKAVAGGGGRGMRVVKSESEMSESIDSAKRESLSSFGDDTLLIEKYVNSARHIEVQIIGDNYGNVAHLFERECSLQRRHQKVIEEAPAPGLQKATRDKLFEAAIIGGKAIDYSGVGTFEFLVDPDGHFWFLEMNTRIQVEHPVTEFITGLDIVELQIRVARDEQLPEHLKTIRARGHAIEARLYLENPDFTPSFGKLYHLGLPEEDESLRIDRGVIEGDEVSLNYDPMIAKLIGYGSTRDQALEVIHNGLRSIKIGGPATNEDFLLSLVNNPHVRSGDFDTKFIETNIENLRPRQDVSNQLLAISAYALMVKSDFSGKGHSPWFDNSGWRLGASLGREIKLRFNNRIWDFTLQGNTISFREEDLSFSIEGKWTGSQDFHGKIDQEEFFLEIYSDQDDFTVFTNDQKLRLKCISEFQETQRSNNQSGTLTSPMPGVIVNVLVNQGQEITEGESLLVLEAMKTEHVIRAPHAGIVKEMFFFLGDQVSEGVELLTIRK